MFAMPYSKKNLIPILLAQSFFSLWAVCRASGLSSRSILAPILFTAFFLYFKHISRLEEKRPEIFTKHASAIAMAVSFLFTLLFLLAESPSLTDGLDHKLFQLVILAVCGIGFFFLVSYSLAFLLILSVPYTLTENPGQVKHIPLFCLFACLLGWFPYFLYEYPAIMTPRQHQPAGTSSFHGSIQQPPSMGPYYGSKSMVFPWLFPDREPECRRRFFYLVPDVLYGCLCFLAGCHPLKTWCKKRHLLLDYRLLCTRTLSCGLCRHCMERRDVFRFHPPFYHSFDAPVLFPPQTAFRLCHLSFIRNYDMPFPLQRMVCLFIFPALPPLRLSAQAQANAGFKPRRSGGGPDHKNPGYERFSCHTAGFRRIDLHPPAADGKGHL